MKTGKKKTRVFDGLKEAVEEMVAIEKGEKERGRVYHYYSSDDIKAIRNQVGASQLEFALMLGVSQRTLQDWEQGRRTPTGSAMALLKVFEKEPKAVVRALTV